MKKYVLAIVSFLSVFILSGCGKIDMLSSTKVNEKGSGSFSFKIAYDKTIASLASDGFLKTYEKGKLSKDEQVNKYMDNDNYVEEYKVSFNSLSDLNNKFKSNRDYNVKITANRGLFSNTYTYEMRFPNGFNSQSIRSQVNSNKIDIPTSSSNDQQVNSFINDIPFSNEITLPGKIVTSNAVESYGNTLKWTYTLGQISPNTLMTATYTIENKTNEVISGVVGIIIIGFVIYYVIARNRKLKTD